MDRRFHKRAISAAAAVMTLTTVVTSVDAAAKNEITIESDKLEARAGDRLSVDVGISPDSVGVAGFTLDLHYDPEAVSLVIPADSDYAPDSKFTLVTNFEYQDGAVRIVGVNPTGGNVTAETAVAELEFTVNDGYSGEAGFWTEVEDLIAVSDGEFYNTEFTAFSEYSPYVVNIISADDSQPAESLPSPDESSEADSSAADSLPGADSLPESNDSSEAPATLPEEMIPPADVVIPDVPDVEEPSSSEADSSDNTDSTTDPAVAPVPDNSEYPTPSEVPDGAEEGSQSDPNALFSYKQGDEDYNNESALQYTFSPFDFAEDGELQTVDIAVTVESDGGAAGGIGMQTADGWEIYSATADGSGEAVWTAEDVDLSQISGDVAVQLYYLQHNSEFKITGISVTASGTGDSASSDASGGQGEQGDVNANDVPTPTPDVQEQPDAVQPEQPSDENYGDSSDNGQPQTPPAQEDVQGGENGSDTDSSQGGTYDESSAADSQGESEASSSVADGSVTPANNGAQGDASAADQSSSMVDSSSAQGSSAAPAAGDSSVALPKADANPDTGSLFGKNIIPIGIIGLCLTQIIYSSIQLLKKER